MATETAATEWATAAGVDFRRAHRAGNLKQVRQAVEIAYNLSLLPSSDSPFAKDLLRNYKILVAKIGYDPIP